MVGNFAAKNLSKALDDEYNISFVLRDGMAV